MEIIESSFSKIIKRDGSPVEFNLDRIVDAIFKAAQAVGGQDRDLATQLAQQVMNHLKEKIHDRVPSVEEIQDTIEKILIETGHAQTVKAFILYREKRKEFRETRSSFLAIEKTVEQYLPDVASLSRGNTFQGLVQYTSESMLSHYALNKIYPPSISEAHRDGMIHIHHLGSAIAPSSLILKSPFPIENLNDALIYLEMIQSLRREWQGYFVITDFELIFEFLENAHFFLRHQSGLAKIFIHVEKMQTWNRLCQLADPWKIPGIVVKSSLIQEKAPVFPAFFQVVKMIEDSPFYPSILDSSGSPACLGIVSINLKRLAQEAFFKKDFLSNLEKYIILATQALRIKKKVFEHHFSQGMFQTTGSLISNPQGFLGIGLSGILSAAQVLTEGGFANSNTYTLALEILDFCLERLKAIQDETPQSFGVEFVMDILSKWHELENIQNDQIPYTFKELWPFLCLRLENLEKLKEHSKEYQVYIHPSTFQF